MAKLYVGIVFLVVLLANQQSSAYEFFERNVDEFHSSLYEELAKSRAEKNLLFSPFCTQMGLGMIRLAAKNETANEIDEVAKFTWSKSEEIAIAFQDVIKDYSENLRMANKIYINKNLTPNPNYITVLTEKFNAELEAIDVGDGTTAAININKWVKAKTSEEMNGGVDSQLFESKLDVLLVSYVSFFGQWASQFEPKNTAFKQFNLSSGKKSNVAMMSQNNTFQYAQLDHLKAQALKMDFLGDLSMLIILPNENSNLGNLVSKLRDTPITNITSSLESTFVTLSVPKFKVDVQGDLKPILKNMGLRRIFNDDADLNDMLAQNKQVQITSIQYKAFIEIDEKGAAVGTEMDTVGGTKDEKKAVFTANRPFYFVFLTITDLVLFAGHIVYP